MRRQTSARAVALALLLLVSLSVVVFAQTVQLLTAGSSGTINGAVFMQGVLPGSSGTGVWDPFLRINANLDVTQGYNTDAPPQFQEDDPWTRSLLLSNIPVVEHNGVLYREFILDINQSNQNSPQCGVSVFDCYLSLDELRVFATDDPNLTDYNVGRVFFGTDATLLYDMDALEDSRVEMNAGLSSGSGTGDITVLIPAALFAGYNCPYGSAGCATYITLFSRFGDTLPNNDGFEEWAVANRPYVTVSKTADATATDTYSWKITKGDDATYNLAPGQSVEHPYTVAVDQTKTSVRALSGEITVTLPDDKDFPRGTQATITAINDFLDTGDPAAVTCNPPLPVVLKPGDSLTCTYVVSDPPPNATKNIAEVFIGENPGVPHVGTAVVDYKLTVVGYPQIGVNDTNFPAADPKWTATGDDSWAYKKEFACPTDPSLYNEAGFYTMTLVNTATIKETGQSDDATVTLNCQFPPQALDVAKTAVTTFTRTFHWAITKGPNGDYVGEPGDSWLHSYVIEIDKTGYTDGNWAVSGQITIDNNTPFAATITNVTDEITGVGTVEVTCPVTFPYVLPAGGQLICTYAQPLTSGASRTNTATVTTSGFVGGGTDSKDIVFGNPTTTVNGSVNVTDDFGTPAIAGDDKTFGPFSGDSQVGYDRPFACPTDEAMYDAEGVYTATVVNTAKIDETGDKDTATVTVTCRIPPDENVCPIDAAVYERTDLIGKGMASNVKALKTVKLVVPNPTNVIAIYGQLAGKDQRTWKYARFIRPNGTYINDKTLESPAYRDYAVFWYGEYLTPATLPFWKARLIGAPTNPYFVQRAFLLYPTYRTAEQYVNVWTTFADSTKNHVFWDVADGWIPTQQQILNLPAPLQAVDLVVTVAVVDNDRDTRPFEMTISAGGVSQTVSLTGPTDGDLLNLVKVTLKGVPAGTNKVVIDLVSPHLVGDSVAMVGATANYLCVPSEVQPPR